jgi:beta-galactosidase beta subunit
MEQQGEFELLMKKTLLLTIETDFTEDTDIQLWHEVFREYLLRLNQNEIVVTNLLSVEEIANGDN